MTLRKNLFLQRILRFINFFIPKCNKLVILYSPWRYSGNCYIFHEYLKKNKKNVRFYFKFISEEEDKETIKILSIKGIWSFFRAKYVLTTHGSNVVKVKRQKVIALHHGIPLKKITLLDQKNKVLNYRREIDFFVTNSFLTSSIYSYAFDLHPNQILEFGEPLLYFYDNIELFLKSEDKKEISKIKQYRKKYRKIVLFSPTYRDKWEGRQTGEKIELILEKFMEIIRDNENMFFIINLHPRDKDKFRESQIKLQMKNFKFGKISSEKYLPFIDVSVNDYSSLFFNSIYLNKEVIMFMPDLNLYMKNVGLLYKNLEVFDKNLIFEKYNLKFKKILNNYPKECRITNSKIRELYFYDFINSNEKLLDFLNDKMKN